MASIAENNNNNNDEDISTKKLLEISQTLYDTYYGKPYKKSPPTGSSQELQAAWQAHDLNADHGVERPNHALAHSMRKAFLVPIVIDTFQKYYKDDKSIFKFSKEDIFALQVALLLKVLVVKVISDIMMWRESEKLHNQFDANAAKISKIL